MTEPTFRSTYTWNPERIRALAIYCSDGRWGEAFDEFCHEGLHIPRYDRFAVPGGPAWLTLRDISLLTPYSAAREQLDFLVRAHELERIVLVAHYGCAFYAQITRQEPDAFLSVQIEDLRTAAGTVRAWFAGIQVEGYVAMRPEGRLQFHAVEV
jgi:hypothetical protein